ncbi:zinc finger BED domain-containing protein 4-like [Gordionus sp. m RMFG-2023]|uniref:zinc finger BED domain-containing protein 4-like n=1 Tax=Gordionus sp. m RMFG-2023 TaxID=3053472 RepID=UPI0031FD6EE9
MVSELWKYFDKDEGEMIACDHQPISILEDIGFKRLLHHLCPNYKIPNRKYFSQGVIPDIYEKLSEKIRKEILVDDSFLSFTVDIWTINSGGDSHISLTCHYINQNFQQINRVLNVKTFNESHTAINIAQILEEIINYWGIKKNKIHLIIRDNAPNITLAMKNGKFQSVSCFAHSLQLVAQAAILSQRSIIDMLARVRKIVGHFKHSSIAQNCLKEIQIRLSLAQHKLIQDVPTRWDSTYYMLERLIEQKRAVQLFIIDNPNLGNLSLYEWELAERVIDVLEPIQRVTKEISTESCSISNVIPFVEILKSELTINGDTDRGVQTMKNTTNNQLTTRFFYIYDDDNYVVPTLLDPRYKDFFLPKNISYIEKLRTACESFFKGDDNVQLPISNKDSPGNDNEKNVPHNIKKCKFNLRVAYKLKIKEKLVINEIDSNVNDDLPYLIEIKEYLKESLYIEKNSNNIDDINIISPVNPLEYWRVNAVKFPTLSTLARKFLAPPATSVPSESAFSTAGDIDSPHRRSLLPENLEALIFIKKNLIYYNFIY